jgi:hypothetical protein
MVSVFVPSSAELVVVNVRMLTPVVGFGFQSAVTPLGRPDTENVTFPANPFCALIPTETFPDAPRPRFKIAGDERVKLGEFTPRVRFIVDVSAPDVPVIVRVLLPVPAVLLAVRVRTLPLAVGLGEKLAVTPVGSPDTVRFTVPLNPYCGTTEKLDVLEVP